MTMPPKHSRTFNFFPLQGLLGILAWAFACVILVTLWLNVIPAYVFQYILLLRVPIILGILLFGFPILANFSTASSLFQNLFALRGNGQIVATMVSSTMASLMITYVTALILVNAPARFGLPPLPSKLEDLLIHSTALQYGLVAVLVAPTWITIIPLTKAELEAKHKLSKGTKHEFAVLRGYVGIILGIACSLGLIALVSWLDVILNSNRGIKQFIAKGFLFVSKGHPEGYLNNSEITYGHVLGITLGLVGLFVVYALVIFLYQPGKKRIFGEAPALLYLFLLIWIGTLLLGGATFYGDYFRVPVIVSFILFSGLMYLLFGVDHFYKVEEVKNPLLPSNQLNYLGDFQRAVKTRLQHQPENQKTLVVICASGGGIQAAGWTVQVLTSLQQLLGTSFTKAIGLISSASGGSVGSMYFLDKFANGFPPQSALGEIVQSATEDGLDAVGWGLAYPDLVRAIGLPFLVDKYCDRGSAMESDWQQHLQKPKATLADWRHQIFNGEIPIPVFNATLVEDGRRFLITPMTFIKAGKPDSKALDFNTLFFDTTQNVPYDLSVTTAARLSATFPYVSPSARNDQRYEKFKRNYHIADGGYFDNAGLFTAIEWLDEWLDIFSKTLKINRVLLLQINAFPESSLKSEIPGGKGWFMEFIGPLLALSGVRDSTQVARNQKEADLLKNRWAGKVEIQSHTIFFPSGVSSKLYNPPLSWKLTERQKQNLQNAWDELQNSSVINAIQNLWHNTWGMPQP
jgi:hypothetical protein